MADVEIIAEFRANGGRVGGPLQGSDILLLHHTGARSGIERVSPLAFQWVGQSFAVFAARGGAPRNPAWFYNLRASPLTTVEIGAPVELGPAGTGPVETGAPVELGAVETATRVVSTRTVRVRARTAQPAERDVICDRQRQRQPAFAQYEAKAAPRRIPVVVLDPLK